MSLQTSSSLPPEKSPEQSTAATTLPVPGKSYSRRLVEHAWKEVRGHNKVELIATTIVTVGAALIGGFTWGSVVSGLVAGVVMLAAMLIVIFGVNLALAPRAL